MKEINKKNNKYISYILYFIIAIIITVIFFFAFNFFVGGSKTTEEKEIKNTINNFASSAINIGNKLTVDNILDENYNYNARLSACTKAMEYMTKNADRTKNTCYAAADMGDTFMGSRANSSFLDKVEVESVEMDSRMTEADIKVNLYITMQSGKNVLTDVSDSGPMYEVRTSKEPLEFKGLKLKLVKKEDKWLVDNDKDFSRELAQLYALWISSDSSNYGISLPYEENNIEMLGD